MTRARDLGRELRSYIEDTYVIEGPGWATEQVQRVMARLQAEVPVAERLDVLVPWMSSHSAFTAPGNTIYITRRLLERCPSDEVVAFILAHEIAHHELGHTAARLWHSLPLVVVVALRLDKRAHGQAEETAADLRAIDLCIEAGYDPWQCVRAFDVLVNVVLDERDVVGVCGDDPGSGLAARAHPPLLERERAVRERVRAECQDVPAPCRRCRGTASQHCPRCGQGGCARHGWNTPICTTCRVDEQVSADQRRQRRSMAALIAVAAIVAALLGLMWFTLYLPDSPPAPNSAYPTAIAR